MSTEGGTKAVVAALFANLGIAVAKFVAWSVTGSSSMLSEAIHSVADSCNQMLLLFGGKRAKKGESATHQFGYGRVRYVYAFVVAIILFLIGGMFSLYEGLHKFQHPEDLNDPTVAFIVLGVAIVLEAFSFRTAIKESNRARGDRSLRQFIRAVRQPELPVILLEDAGALVGLVFALFGVTMATVTKDGRWDGIGAMAVGLLLVVIAIFLAFEMASMLVGEAALPEQDAAIRAAMAGTAGITAVIHMRTLHVGPDDLLVAAKVGVEDVSTGIAVAETIDRAEAQIRAAVPEARYVYLEPDILRADDGADAAAQRPAADGPDAQ